MILYSVTVTVGKDLAPEWLAWMQEVHIPEVMATGRFLDFDLHQLLDPVVDPEMVTYNIQYHCRSLEDYEAYQREEAPALQEAHSERYQDKALAFRTILKRFD